MSIEEFFMKLRRHDWFYEYSDDHGVWQRGQAARYELRQLAKENDTFALMYDDYINYINAIVKEGPKQESVPVPKLEDYL